MTMMALERGFLPTATILFEMVHLWTTFVPNVKHRVHKRDFVLEWNLHFGERPNQLQLAIFQPVAMSSQEELPSFGETFKLFVPNEGQFVHFAVKSCLQTRTNHLTNEKSLFLTILKFHCPQKFLNVVIACCFC